MQGDRRYLRPGRFLSRILNPLLVRLGLVPTLAVRGRRSGRWRTVPVNVLELDGARYLIAPRGETDWVRNLRAAGGGELRRGSRSEAFRAVEVPDEEKPPLIGAYLERWGYQVKGQFDALPDPSDHPVFRVEPA
jgi:deazaflavin-dependent oxidoreductase (nitroreductase family)